MFTRLFVQEAGALRTSFHIARSAQLRTSSRALPVVAQNLHTSFHSRYSVAVPPSLSSLSRPPAPVWAHAQNPSLRSSSTVVLTSAPRASFGNISYLASSWQSALSSTVQFLRGAKGKRSGAGPIVKKLRKARNETERGQLFSEREQFSEAATAFLSAAELFKEANETASYASALAQAGGAKLSAGETDEAQKLLEQSHELTSSLLKQSAEVPEIISPEEQKERTRASMGLFQSLAAMASLQGENEKAYTILRDAMQLVQQNLGENAIEVANINTQMAIVALRQKRYKQALRTLQEVEKVWAASEKHDLRLRGLTLQFAALDQLSDLQGLIKAGERAVETARKLGDREQEWYALDLQGCTATRMNDFPKALSTLEAAVKLAHDHVHWEAESSSYLSLGSLHEMRKDPDAAIEAFRTALRLSRSNAHASQYEISALASLGRCYLVQGQYDDAMLQLRAALQLASNQKQPNKSMMAKTSAFLGHALHASDGDLAEARQYLEDALRMSTEMDDEDLIRLSSADLGAVLLETNHPREAIVLLEKAEKLNHKLKDNVGLMKCTAILASCYRLVGDFERAQNYVKLTAQLEMQLKPLGLV